MRLDGKVAIVTGGARGIGRAIGIAYAAEGARVVVADINAAEAESVAAEIGPNASGLGAMGIGVNVTQQASIDAMVATVVERAGRIDILVNNAGVFEMGPIVGITRESYAKQFGVNVEGLLFTLQAVARQMIAQGHGGKIVNFASQAGRRGEALVTVYCATKAAVISMTQSAGLELIKHGINVNGIAPGVVDTPMWDVVDAQFAKYQNLPLGEKKRQVGLAVPYGRMGRVEDMTGAAVFLASAEADYIVAQTLNVDGGNWMS
jgi:NAD(P)-dependent dehydrogenase (short-subunit alcohol dehydrogenase family)